MKLKLDHIGIIVGDVDESEKVWRGLLSADLVFRQPDTAVDADAFRLAEEAVVRVAMLDSAAGGVELLQYVKPSTGKPRLGIDHIAYGIEPHEFDTVRDAWGRDVDWYGPVQRVENDAASGITWCYGDIADNVRVELIARPPSMHGAICLGAGREQ